MVGVSTFVILASSSSSLLLLGSTTEGFQPLCPSRTTTTVLEARRVKKQSLAILAEDGVVSTTKRVKQQSKRQSPKRSSSSGGSAAAVSDDLAKWAASMDTSKNVDDEDDSMIQPETPVSPVAAGTEFVSFVDTSKKSDRRVRQSERQQIDQKQAAAIRLITEELEEVLEGKNNIDDILSITKKLMQQESTFLKTLTAGQKRHNYRLAWVGSDDALTHIGTGLHKVPLARMQEVFLMLQERSRLEVYEVISVLGPFPNVRNTLQGSSSVKGGGSPNEWKILYDSMIDGAGKQLLAGSNESTRKVNLQVYFADQNAIIAVVPPEDGSIRSDPLEDNGSNMLVFIGEEDLDDKLEALRVL